MEEQLIEVDLIADLRVALEDAVGPDAVVNVGGKVLPEQPEVEVLGEAEGFAAGDLGDIDIETPSRTADSISATAGTQVRPRKGLIVYSIIYPVGLYRLGWAGQVEVRLGAIRWHLGTHNNTLEGVPVPLGLWTGFLTVWAFLPIRGCTKHPGTRMRYPRVKSGKRALMLPTLGLSSMCC